MRVFTSNILKIIFLILVSACQAKSISDEIPTDYSKITTEELLRLHENNDLQATFTLGFNHFFNDDASVKDNVTDVETGLAYLQEAHDKGHMEAHANLSLIYEMGLFDVPTDHQRANQYNLDGAERGSTTGKLNFGLHNLYNESKEIALKAHDYLFDVASVDNLGGVANEHLAHLYYFGNKYFDTNFEKARAFAENCVLFDSSEGWCEFILARDLSEGWGGPKDINRSAELFIKAGEKGNATAMWYAGMNALNGTGVERDEKSAFEWVKKSSELDYMDAMISLGVMHALGQGTEIDFEKSYNSYVRAAKLGSAHAIRAMAGMYCKGQGRQEDDEKCFSGTYLAMEHGDDQAPLLLKDWFVISDSEIETMKKQRPPQESYWTAQYPWLSDKK